MGFLGTGLAPRPNSWYRVDLLQSHPYQYRTSGMTQCTTEPLSFANLGSRRVEADFSGGDLTTDAGVLLLREADRRLGLIDGLDAVLPDPRHPFFITHPQRALLAQRIFGLACGYEDLNDHAALRHDPLWQAVAEYDPAAEQPLASAPTL